MSRLRISAMNPTMRIRREQQRNRKRLLALEDPMESLPRPGLRAQMLAKAEKLLMANRQTKMALSLEQTLINKKRRHH